MGDLEYEIIGYNIKDFEYRSPKAFINENGECQIKYGNNLMTLGSITLLQRHTIQNGKLVSLENIEAANNFLLHKKINDELTSLSTYSTALIHYFHFLETQTIGLGECSNGESCEKCNKRPMKWDEMPFRNSHKPTYKYRKHLKAIYASNDQDEHLARSTCNSYIGAVTNFYKYYLLRGFQFRNKPFEHEILQIEVENKSDRIQVSSTQVVHTTDLRLKLGRDMRNDGTKRILVPLSDKEWQEVDRIIRKERQIIKVVNGNYKVSKLDIESSFMFLFERYTGARREEMLTLRTRHVRLPTERDTALGYCPVDIGSQSNSVTKGEGNPDRTIHVPLGLMRTLHNYVNSSRYIKRRQKYDSLVTSCKKIIEQYTLAKENIGAVTFEDDHTFKTLEKKAKEATVFLSTLIMPKEAYIFLNNKGKPYSLASSNARWCEIRNTVSKSLGYSFTHKPHNLRSTYAVNTLKQLLAKGMSADKAIDYIQSRLGHVSTETTMIYLKFAQNELSGHEVYEHALDFLLDDVDCEVGNY